MIEKVRMITSEHSKILELQHVMRPPEAPLDSKKCRLSRKEPAKLLRNELDTCLTFDSCKHTTTFRSEEITCRTIRRLEGLFKPRMFQMKMLNI